MAECCCRKSYHVHHQGESTYENTHRRKPHPTVTLRLSGSFHGNRRSRFASRSTAGNPSPVATSSVKSGPMSPSPGDFTSKSIPKQPQNECITDLKRAPRNAGGKVEFWVDFFLIKPVDPAKGNGRLLYDVHNRGNKLALWTFNDTELTNDPVSAGNGFLFHKGYSLLWTGWNGDVVGDGTGRLLAGLPVAAQEDGSPITGKTYVETSVDEKVYSKSLLRKPVGNAGRLSDCLARRSHGRTPPCVPAVPSRRSKCRATPGPSHAGKTAR